MDERTRRREQFLKERWRASAHDYAAASFELDTYRASNAQLVQAADLAPGLRALDLACGGGATLKAAFDLQPALGPCWGVDWVDTMLVAARAALPGLPITFLEAPAQDFAQQVGPEQVERVLCNSAFFQFDQPRRVLAEVHAVLTPGGRVAFTLPGPSNTAACMRALQDARLVAPPTEGLGLPDDAERCEAHNAELLLLAARFSRVSRDEVSVRSSPRDYARWFSLPVFRRPEWHDRPQAELEAALEQALIRAGVEPERTWITFTATRA
jgi:SAM-dependent methyltransferase